MCCVAEREDNFLEGERARQKCFSVETKKHFLGPKHRWLHKTRKRMFHTLILDKNDASNLVRLIQWQK